MGTGRTKQEPAGINEKEHRLRIAISEQIDGDGGRTASNNQS